jgi:hypothetical protein
MIRLSQLFALGVKDIRSTIYSRTFAVNEPCYGQVTNHRNYATAPQGINLIF